MARAKITNTNTEKKSPTRMLDRYPELLFVREHPMPEAIINKMVSQMLEFADRPTTLRAGDFFIEHKINNWYYYTWKDKYPDLEAAYKYMLACIASRRDKGAITKQYDGNYIKDQQALYDPEYKALLEWRANLAKKEENQLGNITVVVEKFQDKE